MSEPFIRNPCVSCPAPLNAPVDPVIAHLLDRIAELEGENYNLRRLEETIRRNIYLFDVLLKSSQDSILLLTPQMIVFRLIHSVLGYAEMEVVGQPLLAFVHPDDVPRMEAAFSSLLDGTAQSDAREFRIRNAQGAWSWVQVHMTDMLDDPNVQAVVLNCRRVSEPAQAPESAGPTLQAQ